MGNHSLYDYFSDIFQQKTVKLIMITAPAVEKSQISNHTIITFCNHCPLQFARFF